MRAREVEMDDAFIAAWLRKYLIMQPKETTFSDPKTCYNETMVIYTFCLDVIFLTR